MQNLRNANEELDELQRGLDSKREELRQFQEQLDQLNQWLESNRKRKEEKEKEIENCTTKLGECCVTHNMEMNSSQSLFPLRRTSAKANQWFGVGERALARKDNRLAREIQDFDRRRFALSGNHSLSGAVYPYTQVGTGEGRGSLQRFFERMTIIVVTLKLFAEMMQLLLGTLCA